MGLMGRRTSMLASFLGYSFLGPAKISAYAVFVHRKMGNIWSMSGAWQHTVVTQEDIKDAVRGFETWQKAQEAIKASGAVQHFDASSTLLDRVGGPTIVRRAVEIFCRRMYADEQLAPLLKGTDIVRLRAKQSAFLLWLLSPSDQPASSRHSRTAHLPIIRSHGFNREHFKQGLRYLGAALEEVGVAEVVLAEVMDLLQPYENMTFTPLPREEGEERRLAALQRLRNSQQVQQQQQQGQENNLKQQQLHLQQAIQKHGQQQHPGRQQQQVSLDRTASGTTSAITNNSSISGKQVDHHRQQKQQPTQPSPPPAAPTPVQPPRPTSASQLPPKATPDLTTQLPPPSITPDVAAANKPELLMDLQPSAVQLAAQPQPQPAQPQVEAPGDPSNKTSAPLTGANSAIPHPTPAQHPSTHALHRAISPPLIRSQAPPAQIYTRPADVARAAEATASPPLPEPPAWLPPHPHLAAPNMNPNASSGSVTNTSNGGFGTGFGSNNNIRSSSSSGIGGVSSSMSWMRLAPLPAAAGAAGGGAAPGMGPTGGGGGGGGGGHLLTRPTRSLPPTGMPVMARAAAPAATATAAAAAVPTVVPSTAQRLTAHAAASHAGAVVGVTTTAVAGVSVAAIESDEHAPSEGNSSLLLAYSFVDGECRTGDLRAAASTASSDGSQFVAAVAGMVSLPPPPPFSPPLHVMRHCNAQSALASPVRANVLAAAVVAPPPLMSPPLPSLPSPLQRPLAVPPLQPSAAGGHSSSRTSSGSATPVYGAVVPPFST